MENYEACKEIRKHDLKKKKGKEMNKNCFGGSPGVVLTIARL